MDADPDSGQAFCRLKDTVRISFSRGGEDDRGLKFIVEEILFQHFRIQTREIMGIQDFPKRGVYDITFTSNGIFRDLVKKAEDTRLVLWEKGVQVVAHVPDDWKLVTVKMYSPFVSESEIRMFLSAFFKEVKIGDKICNEWGIWTVKWKFYVKPHLDPTGIDGIRLPPARFKVRQVNGDLYFSGMPPFCRQCKNYGHMQKDCQAKCHKCGSMDHHFSDCTAEKKCRLCYRTGHLYASCPHKDSFMQQERAEFRQTPAEAATNRSKETRGTVIQGSQHEQQRASGQQMGVPPEAGKPDDAEPAPEEGEGVWKTVQKKKKAEKSPPKKEKSQVDKIQRKCVLTSGIPKKAKTEVISETSGPAAEDAISPEVCQLSAKDLPKGRSQGTTEDMDTTEGKDVPDAADPGKVQMEGLPAYTAYTPDAASMEISEYDSPPGALQMAENDSIYSGSPSQAGIEEFSSDESP